VARLHARPGTPEAALGDALSWLWRLPPTATDPEPGAVGLGGAEDAAALAAAVREGRLAGAAVLAGGEGPADGPLPERRRMTGAAARFDGGTVEGDFALLDAPGTQPAVRSSAGAHAVRDGRLLVLGAGVGGWGSLSFFWVLRALAGFVSERLERPLALLPPVGCLRLDDAPGTAELQLQGLAKDDAEETKRIDRILKALDRSGSRLVAAVVAHALWDDGERSVPIDQVWPRAVEALSRGVEAGQIEPACHGLLHLDAAARAEGRIEAREFLNVSREEAGRLIDEASAWMTERLGPPRSFIAPAWGYSDGALAAAAERGLPTWTPPEPGPLLEGLRLRESLHDGLPGLHRLDYSPLAALASAGLPPTVVFHGRLLDGRMERLRARRDVVSLARLVGSRDLERIAGLAGVRWIGAAELVERLRAHEAIEPREDGPAVPDGVEAVLLRP
jgi:peptidoglycan/xylan/chitin deacetylase (PgdA/CDA1 family)